MSPIQCPPYVKRQALPELYKALLKNRLFDRAAVNLQRTGRMGTYPSCFGQEAVGVAIGWAMQENDVLCPYYREVGALLMRKVRMEEILLYWGGDERGSAYQHNAQDMPISVPIASQLVYAAGIAKAMQLRKQPQAVVATVGDGGTSKGDFYEAINAAGLWKLPLVIVIINNEWAISVPRSAQTASHTLAEKAAAGGVPFCVVDGNDPIAMVKACYEACDNARAGKGATVIEAQTYRLCDHTTADDASRYNDPAEHAKRLQKEPLQQFRNALEAEGLWSEADEQAASEQINHDIESAIANYLNTAPKSKTSLFDHLYATCPEPLLEQVLQLENA